MFLDEARLAAHLDHSNIVQTMELGEHENRYYMVMEFLAGLSMAMVIRRAGERLPGGKVPVPLALNMVAQSCAGLHYAHERSINGKFLQIVHRDISPQNLVVSFEGVVKVVDFGIAKAELRETKTKSGTIKGKFAYMSPEQCVAANVDRRTDVFALGVITWELLTGRRLFKRPSPYETYQAVIDCNVEVPSKLNHELDPALDAVVMKAVAKDKDDRYPTAEAFGDALLSYLHHRGKGSGPGDVSRFFDASFAQEIEEHGARMRELISGRDFSVDTGVNWDGEEEEKKRSETVDLSSKKGGPETQSISLSAADMIPDRPSVGGLSDVIGDLGETTGNSDEDEIPADKTRIETNPLERVNEMERERATPLPPKLQAARGAVPAHSLSPQTSPTVALKTDRAQSISGGTPKPAVMPPSGPLPLPAPPTGPVATGERRPTTGGGFPNFSHLPTMIADPEPEAAQAKTALGGALVDPNTGGPASQPTMQPQMMGNPGMQRPPGQQPPAAMAGYPVMSAEMSEQIARGADIFPSRPPGAAPQAAPHIMQPTLPPMVPHQPHGQHMPQQTLQPQDAAHLMSPVGQQYPQQVNWAEAAAMPARALPPWMLALVFVGAITLALVITVIIAKIAR